jgi:hypothetical protein
VRLGDKIKKNAFEGILFDAQPNGLITSEGLLKTLKGFVRRVSLLQPILYLLLLTTVIQTQSLYHFLLTASCTYAESAAHTAQKLQSYDCAVMKSSKNAFKKTCAQ